MIIKKNNPNINLSDINVFVCAPCMGKTTLANSNVNFIDMDKIKSVYKYGDAYESHEAQKGLCNKVIINEDSFEYICKKTFELLGQGKKLLFNAKPEYRKFLSNNNIAFCLVYFHPDRTDELVKKMTDRGNTKFFTDAFTYESQLNYFNEHENDIVPAIKIILEANEHLADIF